jgi:hypothetical protein
MSVIRVCIGLAIFASTICAESLPIRDEKVRLEVLHAIFPSMKVALIPGKRIDNSWPKGTGESLLFFPDAMSTENVYRVDGSAQNEIERCA